MEAIIDECFGPDDKYRGAIFYDRLWIFERVPVSQTFPNGWDHRWVITPDFHGWNHGQGWAWNGTGNLQGEYGNEPTVTSAATIVSSYLQTKIPRDMLDALEAVVLSMRMKQGLMA